MNINIREAIISDYEELCEVYKELDEYHRENHPELFIKNTDCPRTLKYVTDALEDENKTIFVAEGDSKVIGFAECNILETANFPVFKSRQWVQIDSLAVRKNYQNHHIGSMLLDKTIEWAKSKEIERIELKVYSFNNGAVDFYLRNGFMELSKTMYVDI